MIFFEEQNYHCYGQAEWSSQFANFTDELDRNTALQSTNGSEAMTVQDHIEVLPSTTGAAKKKARQKNKAHRGSSFTQEEDKIRCFAFLNVSKDPITRVNQNAGGYYKRIHEYFCKHKQGGGTRSQLAVQHRWQLIQKGVNKFCSYKSMVDRRKESGKCEQDRIDDAVKLYEAKEPFSYMHCWKLLCKEPKWNDRMLELNRPKSTTKVAPISQDTTENENNTIPRPEGRDSAKRRKASAGDAGSSTTAIDVLQKIHERHGKNEAKQEQQMQEIFAMKAEKLKLSEKLLELQKKEIEKRSEDMEKRTKDMEKRAEDRAKRTSLKEEQLSLVKKDIEVRAQQSEAQLLTAEVGIMGADLDKLAPHVRAYYIFMQHKIMERRGIYVPHNSEE